MKKTFKLTDEKKAPARQVDSVKHQIKKYIAREKRKNLPKTAGFWDFECNIGPDAENIKKIFVNEIRPTIDKYVGEGKGSFYIELFAKAVKHSPKNT